MNIFFLHRLPSKAAQMHCDKHVVKMVLETAQLLSTAWWMLDDGGPYKPTHTNHPSAVWVRRSIHHYNWTLQLFNALCAEYSFRYGKVHKCASLLPELDKAPKMMQIREWVDPPQCMPDEYKHVDTVTAYRAYYRHKQDVIDMRFTKRESWL